jgi:hypothetical protein
VLSGGLSWAWAKFVTVPGVEQRVTLELTAEFERLAAAAKAAADLKTFKAIEAATNHYIAQQQEDAAWREAQDELTRRETTEYERRISVARRSACSLDQLDLDYLDGRVMQPTGPTARGGGN